MQTHDIVRQILMNELGFTRDEVRAEMRKIIEAETPKIVAALFEKGGIQVMVKAEFDRLLKSGYYGPNGIEKIVREEAAKLAGDFMASHFKIVPLADKVGTR
jgi:hypothetical protein